MKTPNTLAHMTEITDSLLDIAGLERDDVRDNTKYPDVGIREISTVGMFLTEADMQYNVGGRDVSDEKKLTVLSTPAKDHKVRQRFHETTFGRLAPDVPNAPSALHGNDPSYWRQGGPNEDRPLEAALGAMVRVDESTDPEALSPVQKYFLDYRVQQVTKTAITRVFVWNHEGPSPIVTPLWHAHSDIEEAREERKKQLDALIDQTRAGKIAPPSEQTQSQEGESVVAIGTNPAFVAEHIQSLQILRPYFPKYLGAKLDATMSDIEAETALAA